jgi:transposase
VSSTGSETKAIRNRLAELIASGNVSAALELVDELAGERDELAAKIDKKQSEIVWLRRMLFGRKSEKLSAEELGQLLLAYGASEAEALQDDPSLPVPALGDVEPEEIERKPKVRRPNHRGRTKLSEDLERIVTNVPVPASERACTCCGAEMTTFDHVEHERLEYVPAKFQVHIERREKLGCRQCKGDAATADRKVEPVSPLRVGPSVLAYLIESKCDDALPIHRQCDQFARLGFELPPSTGYGYWKYATDLLLPICDALLGTVLEDPVCVGVDDTGIDVLDRTRKGGKYRGHFWCFRGGSTGLVAYQFTETWEVAQVAPWFQLIGSQTHVQVDDYAGYGSTIQTPDGRTIQVVPPNRRLGCMMHVRRRFYDAVKAGDKRAAKPVAWIQKIYKVEEQARGRSPDERLALRTEHSLPLLDQFDAWVDTFAGQLGKTGKLVEAVRYAKQQRPFIRRCFSDGRFEIDNGAVERAIRKPAVGRRNFLFTGSAPAAARLAGAYSIVQTCRALGIPTREYLIDVLTKLESGWPARRLTELLPQRWAEHRPR